MARARNSFGISVKAEFYRAASFLNRPRAGHSGRLKRKATKMGKVENVGKAILAQLLADFQGRGLGADALQQSYEGVSLKALKEGCLASDKTTTPVDFDLALADLEKGSLVRTGPMVPYENTPGSAVFVIGLFSKREWVSLSDKGYKAAR